MKGFGDLYKIEKKKNKKTKFSKKELINQAIQLHSKGNIKEAKNYYEQIINQGWNDERVFFNYGIILQGIGKLKEAEFSYRKAIELNPDYLNAHLNLGNILRDLDKLEDAEISTRKAIELDPYYSEAHSNLGVILRDLDKLEDAEISIRKAIELNKNNARAHSNLGNILLDFGNLKEAELCQRKAIELDPDLAIAYYLLSGIKYSYDNNIWRDQIFSKIFIKNKSPEDQVYIYFSRANISHKEKKYKDSSRFLQLANNLKLSLYPSDIDTLRNKSRRLLVESEKKEIYIKDNKSSPESIFIVGMPRCGSTLLESILSMSNDVYDLGETNFLEEAFLECKKSEQNINFSNFYHEKVKNKTKLNITTNKNLYNYQYVGFIAREIPNAKIIHCFRHPLDNILSIYKAHFSKGNRYSSSLVDCAKIYLDQEEIMCAYKNRFRSKIYDLNYDSLVINPNQEIRDLISWLGWKWQDSFLSPELNTRSVSTASNVEVRSPINTKSIGGWKNYKEMLKPAIEILTQNDKYQDINL